MKILIMNLVKQYPLLRKIYRTCGNTFFRFIGLFIKIDPKLILMNSFGGKKYDDSPKELYEMMKRDPRFASYHFVWAFHEPEKFLIDGAEIIKTDNLHYFTTAMKAKCWITNSGIGRGLSFKKKETLYINTWHGTPLKLMGQDSPGAKPGVKYGYDLQCAQSEFEAKVFHKAFNIPYENFLVRGLPRNDILAHVDDMQRTLMKRKLELPENKKILLYAPTFREYERDESHNCVIRPPVDFSKWKQQLGENYVILLRLHYEVKEMLTSEIDGEFVIDVSDYPTLNDLMIASDALITDYSSIMFDYSILDRPIFIFAYDYETYKKKRGMYFDIREELTGGTINEDELIKLIKECNVEENVNKVRCFRDKYVTEYGHATKATVDAIHRLLQEKK